MKHAYLIIAHNNYHQLGQLIKLLDSADKDIFIHINSMVTEPDYEQLYKKASQSKVVFTSRHSVVWGGYSIFNAVLLTLREARARARYDYYHLLSGLDLPLRSMKEIDDFFEDNLYNNQSKGQRTNYIRVAVPQDSKIRARVTQYNLMVKYWGNKNTLIRKSATVVNRIGYYFQNMIGVDRLKNTGKELYMGSTWWSITDEFAQYLLSCESWLKNQFGRYTFAADEFAIQTVIMNSSYKDTVFRTDDERLSMNLREIDFDRGNGFGSPHIWTIDDTSILASTKNLYARKFDERIDSDIIGFVIKQINGLPYSSLN